MASKDKGYVFRATLEIRALAGLSSSLFVADAFAIVSSVEDAQFLSFVPGQAKTFVQTWTSARIFDSTAELRWRKCDARYNVLLITEKHEPPENFEPVAQSDFTVRDPSSNEEHGFLLWGTKLVEDYWLETRIPRLLRYPGFPIGDNQKPPRLSYRLYLSGEVVRWIRLISLEEDVHAGN
jgi:hypothetical protein